MMAKHRSESNLHSIAPEKRRAEQNAQVGLMVVEYFLHCPRPEATKKKTSETYSYSTTEDELEHRPLTVMERAVSYYTSHHVTAAFQAKLVDWNTEGFPQQRLVV